MSLQNFSESISTGEERKTSPACRMGCSPRVMIQDGAASEDTLLAVCVGHSLQVVQQNCYLHSILWMEANWNDRALNTELTLGLHENTKGLWEAFGGSERNLN